MHPPSKHVFGSLIKNPLFSGWAVHAFEEPKKACEGTTSPISQPHPVAVATEFGMWCM